MSRIFWIRHGPTHAKGMVGWTDIPADLSDTARITRLSAWLPSAAPIISSDLDRARRTADALGQGRSRLADHPDLREIHFGAWEMRSFDDVSAGDGALLRAFYETPGEISAPGGESWNAVRARVDRAVDALNAAHSPKPVIAVAHMGVILSQVQRAMGISAYDAFAHRIEPLSVTEIDYRNGAVRVLNHQP